MNGSRMRRISSARSGFSAVRFVLIFVVSGMASSAVIPFLRTASEDYDTQRLKSLLKTREALRVFHDRNGRYPSTGLEWRGAMERFGLWDQGGNDAYLPELVPDYVRRLPFEPDRTTFTTGHGYVYCSDGRDYKLLAWRSPDQPDLYPVLRDPADPDSWSVWSRGAARWSLES